MKAFLLAAGQGTRLRPITDSLPKCLVPIRGKPILDIWLELCRAHGIDEVLINVHSHAEAVRSRLAHGGPRPQVTIFEEKVLHGSAGTLAINRAWVESEPFFWIFYSDVLTNMNITAMSDFHKANPSAATLGVYRVSNPTECGITVLDEKGTVLEFVEKPRRPPGNLAFSGILIGTPELLDSIPNKFPCDLGFDVFPRLKGRMIGYPIHEYLLDVGTLEKYQICQDNWPGA